MLPAVAPAAVFSQSAPPYVATIFIERAKQAAAPSIAEMRKRNMEMTIAIVDSGSNLVYLERSGQAGIGTTGAAIGKATAANGMKAPTKAVGDLIVNDNQNTCSVCRARFRSRAMCF